MSGSSSLYVNTLPTGYMYCGSRDIAFLVFHAIYKDHEIKGSCDYMDRSPSGYVNNLPV